MVADKKIPPPWVPETEGEEDSQFFDEYPDSDEEITNPSKEEQKLFRDF